MNAGGIMVTIDFSDFPKYVCYHNKLNRKNRTFCVFYVFTIATKNNYQMEVRNLFQFSKTHMEGNAAAARF